ncbi:unnamed protein product [Diabrotica balteata]|uniref:Uncharacterized protein n=1 Tax=Diabrotica balteata TaxID=107213 RepID=A0A9N9XD64_DIABA|nr:unnamed protein product [Diabrotica balteata]
MFDPTVREADVTICVILTVLSCLDHSLKIVCEYRLRKRTSRLQQLSNQLVANSEPEPVDDDASLQDGCSEVPEYDTNLKKEL